jgi:hypothetical protein
MGEEDGKLLADHDDPYGLAESSDAECCGLPMPCTIL